MVGDGCDMRMLYCVEWGHDRVLHEFCLDVHTMSLLWLLLVARVSALLCPPSSSSLFLIPRNINLTQSPLPRCFEECARRDCSGVLSEGGVCVAMDLLLHYGTIDETSFYEKECVPGSSGVSVVSTTHDVVLSDIDARIIASPNASSCLSTCLSDSVCASAQFFASSGDCALSRFSSLDLPLTPDVDGYNGTYMEVLHVHGDCHNRNAFLLRDNRMSIRGAALVRPNTTSLSQCLSRCSRASHIAYSEALADCRCIRESASSPRLSFLDADYSLYANACVVSSNDDDCQPSSSFFIADGRAPLNIRMECLNACLSDVSCVSAVPSMGSCAVHSVVVPSPVVERVCSILDPEEFGGSRILFEESGCMSGESLDVPDMSLPDCLHLCVTHPTKSCESVAHWPDHRCSIFEHANGQKKDKRACRYFTLKMITFEQKDVETIGNEITDALLHSQKKKKTLKPGKKHQGLSRKKAKAAGLKLRKGDKDGDDIRVHTTCHFEDITVEISSPTPFTGRVYVRDSSDVCSVNVVDSDEATLKIPLYGNCSLTQEDSLFGAVVVVARDGHPSPLVLNGDLLFRVACDYTNALNTTAVANILRMGNANYHTLPLGGKVELGEMRMEMGRKKGETVKSVQMGQNIQLAFGGIPDTQFDVQRCVASNELDDEELELITKGCPVAPLTIVRGPVHSSSEGVSIPIRAFRFNRGERVKISCQLRPCKNCAQPNCTSSTLRERRSIAHDQPFNGEIVEVEMTVLPRTSAVASRCLTRGSAFALIGLAAVVIVLECVSLYVLRSK